MSSIAGTSAVAVPVSPVSERLRDVAFVQPVSQTKRTPKTMMRVKFTWLSNHNLGGHCPEPRPTNG
ncbi:MAG: hypothetical protein ACI9WU_000081 [Myxococcota bacterium]|jgi:hypothetical protein